MKKLIVILLFVSFRLFGATAIATWDPNTETDLAGYNIYYGSSSGNYNSQIDVGNKTAWFVENLIVSATYFFAVTAYDFSGNESNFSEEVSYTVPVGSPLIRPENFVIVPDTISNGDTLDVSFNQLNEKLSGDLIEHSDINFGFSYRPPGESQWNDVARTDTSTVLFVELPLGEIDFTVWNFYFLDGSEIYSTGATPKRIFIKELVARENKNYKKKIILRIN